MYTPAEKQQLWDSLSHEYQQELIQQVEQHLTRNPAAKRALRSLAADVSRKSDSPYTEVYLAIKAGLALDVFMPKMEMSD